MMDSMTEKELNTNDIKLLQQPSRVARISKGAGRRPEDYFELLGRTAQPYNCHYVSDDAKSKAVPWRLCIACMTHVIVSLLRRVYQNFQPKMVADCNALLSYFKHRGISGKSPCIACRGVQAAEDAHLWRQGWRWNDEEHAQEPAEGHGWHESSQYANEHGSDEPHASAPRAEANGRPRGTSRAHAPNGGHEVIHFQLGMIDSFKCNLSIFYDRIAGHQE